MRIVEGYQNVPEALRGAVVALGNFDGVHRGHRALIAEARRHADVLDAPLVVLAFEPHPQEFFRPQSVAFRLTPLAVKARLIAETGASGLLALPFDAAMAAMKAQDFVADILVGALNVSCVVVGGDFRFGQGRGGDAALLAYMGEMEGFAVRLFDPVEAGDAEGKISSTRIREALKAGRPQEAARLLGHWWSIDGPVGHGEKRGRTIGIPTINMRWSGLAPAYGVYAVRAREITAAGQGRSYDGVANFGIRPMYEIAEPLLETFLFGFSGDLYGQEMSVELIEYLRPEAKYEGLEALKVQIGRDIEAAKAALAAAGRDAPPLIRLP